uniref:Uncharacterized protein n=1 Tax=viral metagenome TaxID=1070528 RepID=A0A6H1ZCR2_9ZZZZ
MDIPKSLIGVGSVAVLGAGMLLAVTLTKEPMIGAELEIVELVKPVTVETSIKVLDKDKKLVTPTAKQYEELKAKRRSNIDSNGHFVGTWQELQEYIQLVNEGAKSKDEQPINGEYNKPFFEKTNEQLTPIEGTLTIKETK